MNLIAKLDRIFSESVRRRDADEDGYIRCISCGKIVHWKDSDAGHYVNRRHLALRYDEKNVNAQCRACNRFDEGNMIGYHAGLIKKYGEGVIQYLEIKKHNTAKYGKFEYQTLIKYYTEKIKQQNKKQ
ncbi:MAG: recombination protein NinG [Prevotellaceae bacterium]|jgi:uncharacterized C2H2 Zn-finger protein|nr:recombination protein NinG [Prevotellaceae bacterium]